MKATAASVAVQFVCRWVKATIGIEAARAAEMAKAVFEAGAGFDEEANFAVTRIG